MTHESLFGTLRPKDRPQAEAHLNALLSPTREGLEEHLLAALESAADANRTLIRLAHYLDASGDRDGHLDRMAAEWEFTRLLCTLCDHSRFLTDIICHDPTRLAWVCADDRLEESRTHAQIHPELTELLATEKTVSDKHDAMRCFHRREILRIGLRDIVLHKSVEIITADLSELADAMLCVAIECAHEQLGPRYGVPLLAKGAGTTCGFTVMAMGKLGGQELNFSSDIDLIFIYEDDGETSGGTSESLSNSEYFHRLGEQIIQSITGKTGEGHIFRVDMRLRPHGRMGPLAASLHSTVEYYGIHGRAWERQALIKARPAAGDLALGEAFLEKTRGFVYRRYFDDETLEEIRETKRQMEALVARRGETEIEVKLGEGGIRDIEFTVQMLQMLNGGAIPELQERNTLRAIDALQRGKFLSPFEGLTLSANYAFLRQVEHRLQIEESRQLHSLPKDLDDLDDFGRRLGYESGGAFMVGYRDRSIETRNILDRFLATEGSGNLWISELLNSRSEAEEEVARLGSLGFADPQRARAELLQLCHGPEDRPHTLHASQKFREVAPILIEGISSSPNPDTTLLRLARMLSNIQAPGTIYDILKYNPTLCSSLVTLVSNSRYLADFIIRDPGLIETFGYAGALDKETTTATLAKEFELLRRAHHSEAALYRLHIATLLRIGMRELLELIDVVTAGHELSVLAEFCLAEVLVQTEREVEERHGSTGVSFAVLALGKLGGAEMGYGSDLDLIFVYDSAGTMNTEMGKSEYFAAISTRLIRRLKERTQYGTLYDIDARLRPDGKKGVLAVSSNRIDTYYGEEAQAWERMALIKARAVAGDMEFGAKVEAGVRRLAFAAPLTASELAEVEDLRLRHVEQASHLDVKSGEGGIAEIEFSARMLQLEYGADEPDLQRSDVLGALLALEDAGHISGDDASFLRESYIFLRRVENRLRMKEGRSGSTLPSTKAAQSDLAKRLNLDGDIVALISEKKRRIHTIYSEIRDRLGGE